MRKAAGKIPAAITPRTKNELALELLDQAISWELPRLPVVADSAYGNDGAFRPCAAGARAGVRRGRGALH